MKNLRWLLVLVLLAGFFAFGYHLGRGSAHWSRFKSELFVSLLVTGREDALTDQGKVYINQLVDMNVHGYLMASQSNLRAEDKAEIEDSLVRLLNWKAKNGFELWLPDPAVAEDLGFAMPGGGAKGGYDMEEQYEVYRERLDAFLKPHQKRMEMLSAKKQMPVTDESY